MSRIVFDVGAHDGTSGIEHCLGQSDAILYSFEPDPNMHSTIVKNYNNNPNFHLFPMAVSDKNGISQFNFCKIGAAHSIYTFKNDDILTKQWGGRNDIHANGKFTQVQTIRLDTFIEKNNISKIDYLHIDAQGADLTVLQSLGKHTKIVKEGCCEAARDQTVSIYKEQTSFLYTVIDWLMKNDFEILSVTPNDPTLCEFNIKFKNNNF
jgi:FkbM family methyltransferase